MGKEEEIVGVYLLQDNLGQYTRKQSLRSIPDSAYSSTEEVVLKLAESLKIPLCCPSQYNHKAIVWSICVQEI